MRDDPTIGLRGEGPNKACPSARSNVQTFLVANANALISLIFMNFSEMGPLAPAVLEPFRNGVVSCDRHNRTVCPQRIFTPSG